MSSKTLQNRVIKHLTAYGYANRLTDLAWDVAGEYGYVTDARAYNYACAVLDLIDAGVIVDDGYGHDLQLAK